MKKCLAACVWLALCICSASYVRAAAAADPGDQFLNAYFLLQDGDAADAKGDWVIADTKYRAALDLLAQIKEQDPNWNPHIIDFRLKYCSEHLEALKPKLPAAPPPTPPAATAAPTSAVPAEVAAPVPPQPDRVQELATELHQSQAQVRQLEQERDALKARLEQELQKPAPTEREEAQKTLDQIRTLEAARDALTARLQEAESKATQVETLKAELQQSQEKLRQLESDRDQLNARLQESLSKAAPAQTNPQLEELLKKNAELTAEVASLKEQLSGGTATSAATKAEADQIQLRTELMQTRTDLERTRQQLQKANQDLTSAKQELEEVRADNVRLRQSQEEIVAKLNESDRQLRASRSSSDKDNEIILQLRKENTLLHQIAERQGTVASREEPPTDEGGLNTELKGWHPRRRAPAPQPVAVAVPNPAPARSKAPSTSSVKESASNKLVATINAPAPVPSSPAKPPPAKAPPVAVAVTNVVRAPPAIATPPVAVTPAPVKPPPPPPPANDVKTLLNEARAAAALKDYETAAAKYQAVLAKEPKNVTALSRLGAIRYEQGKLDDAEELLRQAASEAPNDSATRSLLGVVFVRKGTLDEAFNELTRAVALDPRNAEAHNYLGITLSEKGWGTAAEEQIRRAIELNPQYADAHFNLAVIYAKEKTPRWELARYHYQKALELGAAPDPQFAALLKSATSQKPAPSAADQPEAQQPDSPNPQPSANP